MKKSAAIRKKGQTRGLKTRRTEPRPPAYLFDLWPQIVEKLRATRHLVLFLDFDGTLVRLRRRSVDVRLSEPARRVLRRLARRSSVTLCFISGRGLQDLQRHIGVSGARYLGLHGWERDDGSAAQVDRRRIGRAKKFIEDRIRDLPGVWIQDKGACFAVHYRAARGKAVELARRVTLETLDRLGPDFRLLSGKKIWELLPRQVGTKGDAARHFLAEIPGRSLVFYLGDDTTDESAFAVLRRGVTVRVGKFDQTHAKFYLRNPADVINFLRKVDAVAP